MNLIKRWLLRRYLKKLQNDPKIMAAIKQGIKDCQEGFVINCQYFGERKEMVTKYHECVHCGYCCKLSPCPFGEWDSNLNQCKFLEERDGRFYCGIYNKIIESEKGEISPAFGAGCCSPLNSFRMAIIKKEMKNGTSMLVNLPMKDTRIMERWKENEG